MNDSKTIKPVMLITGTSKGIGKYLAEYYLAKTYIVIGCSRNKAEIKNKNYFHFTADIANEEEILNIFKFIRKEFKRIDVLINNAVVNPTNAGVALLPYNAIEYNYKVNVFAPIIFCRESVKLMSRNKFGRIINIGSMLSKHEIQGTALYTSSKAAINSFTRVLAKEVSNLGITANVLSPSAIHTDLSDSVKEGVLYEILNRNAVKNFGELSDISNAIDFLIKKGSTAVTAQIIYLGGA